MKKLIFLLLLPLFSKAQIGDSLYYKLPWKECFQFYSNFFDHYKNAKISPSVFGYTDAGVLECHPNFRVFLKRKDGWRQEVFIPDSLSRFEMYYTGFFYNPRDTTIGIWYENFDKTFGTILFSIASNEWRIYTKNSKTYPAWHDCSSILGPATPKK